MFWLYLISLIIYIIAFYLRAHKYCTTSGFEYEIPIAKANPNKRTKVPTYMWQILCHGFLFLIPLINVSSSLVCLFSAFPDVAGAEFYIFEKSSHSSQLFIKIQKFLTKEVWPE